jgi:hypothetical protein
VLAPAVGFGALSTPYAPDTWRGTFIERSAEDGVHALLITPSAQHRLWMPTPVARHQPVACVVPLGAGAACASAAVLQFWRHLAAPQPAPKRTSDGRHRRAVMSLEALDAHEVGESYRALAERFFGARRVAAESWRTSSLRDATIRLVRSGAALVKGDYRRLLRHAREE